jgi:hypothetical protein
MLAFVTFLVSGKTAHIASSTAAEWLGSSAARQMINRVFDQYAFMTFMSLLRRAYKERKERGEAANDMKSSNRTEEVAPATEETEATWNDVVWTGILVENGEATQVAIVKEGDELRPKFWFQGQWRVPAPEFGYRIFTQWGRRDGVTREDAVKAALTRLEDESVRLEDESVRIGKHLLAVESAIQVLVLRVEALEATAAPSTPKQAPVRDAEGLWLDYQRDCPNPSPYMAFFAGMKVGTEASSSPAVISLLSAEPGAEWITLIFREGSQEPTTIGVFFDRDDAESLCSAAGAHPSDTYLCQVVRGPKDGRSKMGGEPSVKSWQDIKARGRTPEHLARLDAEVAHDVALLAAETVTTDSVCRDVYVCPTCKTEADPAEAGTRAWKAAEYDAAQAMIPEDLAIRVRVSSTPGKTEPVPLRDRLAKIIPRLRTVQSRDSALLRANNLLFDAAGKFEDPEHQISSHLDGLPKTYLALAKVAAAVFEIVSLEWGRDPELRHDLTPAQVALATCLSVWEAWPGRREGTPDEEAWLDVIRILGRYRYLDYQGERPDLTPYARDLLDRARKAGVI